MVHGISSFGNNDAWLKKRMLEQQAQVSAQNQAGQSIQQVGQNKGNQKVSQINQASGAIQPGALNLPQGSQGLRESNPQGPKSADVSAIGENQSQKITQATDAAYGTQNKNLAGKSKEAESSVAANMPSPGQMTGATQLGDINKFLLVKKKQPTE